jgi:hypothetical protein
MVGLRIFYIEHLKLKKGETQIGNIKIKHSIAEYTNKCKPWEKKSFNI